MEMRSLLDELVATSATDLQLEVGKPPVFRRKGILEECGLEALCAADTDHLMKAITSDANQERLQSNGFVDFGFGYGDHCKIFATAFKAKGKIGLVLRRCPDRFPIPIPSSMCKSAEQTDARTAKRRS